MYRDPSVAVDSRFVIASFRCKTPKSHSDPECWGNRRRRGKWPIFLSKLLLHSLVTRSSVRSPHPWKYSVQDTQHAHATNTQLMVIYCAYSSNPLIIFPINSLIYMMSDVINLQWFQKNEKCQSSHFIKRNHRLFDEWLQRLLQRIGSSAKIIDVNLLLSIKSINWLMVCVFIDWIIGSALPAGVLTEPHETIVTHSFSNSSF